MVRRTFQYALLIVSTLLHCDVTVMSYNVENLFDDVYDGTEFPDYDPRGSRWSKTDFEAKLEAIAEVIRRSVRGGADIIALQEVENPNALEHLRTTLPRRFQYRYSVMLPKAGVSAGVAFLSRYPIERVHSHHVAAWDGVPARDILEVEIVCNGKTLHILNNHWKSKREGVQETESARLSAACAITRRLRSIWSQDADADILVMGDLNENVHEYMDGAARYQTALIPVDTPVSDEYHACSLFMASNPGLLGQDDRRVVLFETWFEIPAADRGSYVYSGGWQTLDHILLSRGLFDETGFSYARGSFRVVRDTFLLASGTGYPKAWSSRPHNRGYSDHLPIVITLQIW